MSALDKAIEALRIARRAAGAVRRGVLKTISTSYFSQFGTGAAGDDERFDDVETWQHFGLASLPPAGTEVLAVLVGGSGEHAVVVAETNRDHRPTLAAGDVALYGTKSGSDQPIIRLHADGKIEVQAGAGDIELKVASGKTAHVGGTGGEKMLLGETVNTDIGAFCTAVGLAEAAWTASAKTPADVVTWVNAVAVAHKNLNTAYLLGWLTAKSKAE